MKKSKPRITTKCLAFRGALQYYPVMVEDGCGGAIIAWQDYRSGTNWDIYAQRVLHDMPLVGVAGANSIPVELGFHGNYPNPFGRTTVISYALPERQHVTIRVFNMLGQQVATLGDRVEDPGFKSVVFDAANLPSGIYTYRLTTAPGPGESGTSYVSVKKMLVVR
ncbi:MAG: T9SS type A sorting domain-containing protein [Candidatus Eisenbacteria bacterium]|nr:T9SS type A sorting domain-containing protein [Candidatus Eisenbacteria bacterium]